MLFHLSIPNNKSQYDINFLLLDTNLNYKEINKSIIINDNIKITDIVNDFNIDIYSIVILNNNDINNISIYNNLDIEYNISNIINDFLDIKYNKRIIILNYNIDDNINLIRMSYYNKLFKSDIEEKLYLSIPIINNDIIKYIQLIYDNESINYIINQLNYIKDIINNNENDKDIQELYDNLIIYCKNKLITKNNITDNYYIDDIDSKSDIVKGIYNNNIKIINELFENINLDTNINIHEKNQIINTINNNSKITITEYEFELKKSTEIFLNISNKFKEIKYLSQRDIPFKNVTNNIQDLINNISIEKPIDFDYKCNNCEINNNKYTISSDILQLSDNLIIHLKKFKYEGSKYINIKVLKDNNYVNYKSIEIINNKKYELLGVICHIGNLDDGHYYYIKKINDSYYKINDDRITDCDCFDKNAYILYYNLIKN